MTSESPADILRHQFSETFVQYMRNRMVQGYMKYGSIKEPFDRIASMHLRIRKYE